MCQGLPSVIFGAGNSECILQASMKLPTPSWEDLSQGKSLSFVHFVPHYPHCLSRDDAVDDPSQLNFLLVNDPLMIRCYLISLQIFPAAPVAQNSIADLEMPAMSVLELTRDHKAHGSCSKRHPAQPLLAVGPSGLEPTASHTKMDICTQREAVA